MSATSARSLIATALLGLGAVAQETPAAADWDRVATQAADHPRFAVRRAAAGRLAGGGDAAVPAIRRLIEARGKDAVPLEIVDAVARSEAHGPEVTALLRAWATDPAFYWRSQALQGLATGDAREHRELFRAALADPAHLYRIAGARGLLAAGVAEDRGAVSALLDDPDPRVRAGIARALLAAGDASGAARLVEAVAGVERRFLDDAWGAREALETVRALEAAGLGDFSAAIGKEPAERAAALDALREWARGKGAELPEGDTADGGPTFTGGLEVRSCRHGDLHLRWTAEGIVRVGLDPTEDLELGDSAWPELLEQLAELRGSQVHGTVICDYVRLKAVSDGHEVHHKVAPGAVPPALSEWLKRLATLFEESGSATLADGLRSRLAQFTPAGGEGGRDRDG